MSYELLDVTVREPKTVIRPNQLRRKGEIPAVVFGKEIGTLEVKVGEHKLRRCLAKASQVLEVQIDGKDKHLVSLEKVQKAPLTGDILHVSFHKLNATEKTTVVVPLISKGEAPGVKEGGSFVQPIHEIPVHGLPQDLPESIVFDVTGLGLNENILMKDVPLPNGIELPKDAQADQAVALCMEQKKEEEPAPEAAAAEGGDAPAEGGDAKAAEGGEAKAAEGGDKK